LGDYEEYDGNAFGEADIVDNKDGTFSATLPMSKIVARIRPLTGQDELEMASGGNDKENSKEMVTRQIKRFVVDFNGYADAKTVNYVVDNMVAVDSKFLRSCFVLVSPDIKMEQSFVCKSCEHKEVMVVPFGIDFFWPDR
jgi:hypothetical protein